MKRIIFIIMSFVFFPMLVFSKGLADENETEILRVYCYDSFSSEWGPGPEIAKAFREKTGVTVEFSAPGDAITVLNQLILEKESRKGQSRADVVVGLDNSLYERALQSGILNQYKSPNLQHVPDELIFDKTYNLLPYDYGDFTVVYDSDRIANPPSSLEDLTDSRFKDSLILMDPRTSTPGLGFLYWSMAVYGDEWPEYWKRLEPSILTIAGSWSKAYALFTAEEAPLVLSYGTSPVYHVEYEDNNQYKAAEFTDGHIRQIEGMGIISGTPNREAAEKFLDFMLDVPAQTLLATRNIMFPINQNVELPESFDVAMKPKKILSPFGYMDSKSSEDLIREWTNLFSR